MNAQYTTKTILYILFTVICTQMAGQCLDYTFKPNNHTDRPDMYDLGVENNCNQEVYFVVLAKKSDGVIHRLLKGHLNVGEKVRHLSHGQFVTAPKGHYAAISYDQTYNVARKTIDDYIINVREMKDPSVIFEMPTQTIVSNEE